MASGSDADGLDAALCLREEASPHSKRAKGQATPSAGRSRCRCQMTFPTARPSWWLVRSGRPALVVPAPGGSPQPQGQQRAPAPRPQDRCAGCRQRPGARRRCRIAPPTSARDRILALGRQPEGCFSGARRKVQHAGARARAPAPRLQEQCRGVISSPAPADGDNCALGLSS